MDLKPLNNKGKSPSPLESNKKAIIIASIVAGILFLGGISYGIYYKVSNTSKQIKNEATNTNNNQVLPSTNTNTSKTSDTSDWQTYQNKNHGFEFQHPNNIKIGGIFDEKKSFYANFCNDVSCFMEPDIIEVEYSKTKNINELVVNYDYKDLCQDQNSSGEPIPGFIKDQKIIKSLDGSDGVLLHFNADGYCTVIQYLKEGKLISFEIGNWKDEKLDETILSTFKFTNTLQTSIENGTVYYTDENGVKRIIAQSIDNPDDPIKDFTYEKAELSPNKKFILLGNKGWEIVIVEIYDIESGQKYNTKESGSEYGEWLSDSRLKIVGDCGMGISCGTFESVNNKIPWVLKEIK